MTVPQEERLSGEQVAMYRSLLGVPAAPPSRENLCALVEAHVTRIPFENISKLYYMKTSGLAGLPGVDRFLEGIGGHHLGGTCYANNYYFYLLLLALGYDARLCGADMSAPDVHLVVMVRIEGNEYIVDGGYGAPFLLPFERDAPGDQVIELGDERYVLAPQDHRGRSRLDLYRDGVPRHGYTAKPEARRIGEFRRVIADSFLPSATFMNALVITRFSPGASIVLRNTVLIMSRGSECIRKQLASRDELLETVEREFGIAVGLAAQALPDLSSLRDAWA